MATKRTTHSRTCGAVTSIRATRERTCGGPGGLEVDALVDARGPGGLAGARPRPARPSAPAHCCGGGAGANLSGAWHSRARKAMRSIEADR
eukprot:3373240-Pyramimonas_sp.AAC.1